MRDALIYLDTNVFIYLLEGPPHLSDPLRRLFDALEEAPHCAVTSELTLAEALAPAQAAGALTLADKRPRYTDLIVASRVVNAVPVSLDILKATADLRAKIRLKLPDAIHVVTAVQANCRFFLSADHDAKKLPSNLLWVHPDANGIGILLGALHA